MDRRKLELMENACQHLQHAGIPPEVAIELILLQGGHRLTPEQFQRLAAGGERRRPARCKVRCTQRPACPYCNACIAVAEAAARSHWPSFN